MPLHALPSLHIILVALIFTSLLYVCIVSFASPTCLHTCMYPSLPHYVLSPSSSLSFCYLCSFSLTPIRYPSLATFGCRPCPAPQRFSCPPPPRDVIPRALTLVLPLHRSVAVREISPPPPPGGATRV